MPPVDRPPDTFGVRNPYLAVDGDAMGALESIRVVGASESIRNGGPDRVIVPSGDSLQLINERHNSRCDAVQP